MGNVTADRAWDVHPVTEADIEAYLDIYLNSYPAYKTLDEECRAHYRSKHLTELREDTQTRTMGLFEGGTLIATMKLILFSMNFFGVMQPACGVMALEVHPLHKKKGAALYMIRYGKRCGFSKRYFLVLVACRHLTCTKTECRKMFLSLIAPLTTIRLNRGKRSNRLPYIFAQGQER